MFSAGLPQWSPPARIMRKLVHILDKNSSLRLSSSAPDGRQSSSLPMAVFEQSDVRYNGRVENNRRPRLHAVLELTLCRGSRICRPLCGGAVFGRPGLPLRGPFNFKLRGHDVPSCPIAPSCGAHWQSHRPHDGSRSGPGGRRRIPAGASGTYLVLTGL